MQLLSFDLSSSLALMHSLICDYYIGTEICRADSGLAPVRNVRCGCTTVKNSVCPSGHDAIIDDSLRKCKLFQLFFYLNFMFSLTASH